MPMAPAQPCGRPGCPHARPCPQHGAGGLTYRERREATPWRALYDTGQWKRLRVAKLRANPTCECAACTQERVPLLATVVDHRVPHRGDRALFFDWANLQSMSKDCHDAKTAREVNARKR